MTRPVRATLQIAVTLVVLGLAAFPLVTVWTLAGLVAALFGSAAVWRLHRWYDRQVIVQVGQPIRNPSPTSGHDTSLPRWVRELPAGRLSGQHRPAGAGVAAAHRTGGGQ